MSQKINKFLIVIIVITFGGGVGFQLYASYFFGLFGFGDINILKCQQCGRIIEQYNGKAYDRWQFLFLPTTYQVIKPGKPDCKHKWEPQLAVSHSTFSSIPKRGTLFVIASWVFFGLALGGFILWLILRYVKIRKTR